MRQGGSTGPDGWGGEPPDPPLDRVDWEPVFALLPDIDAHRDRPLPTPREPTRTAGGVLILGWDDDLYYSDVGQALSEAVHATMAGRGFDWPEFLPSPRGRLLTERANAGDAGDMTLEECRMLLVALVRQDRFVTGAIETAIRSDFVGTVIRRAQALVAG